ncbi:alpha/beta hydrolase family protein [Aliidiomarina maris]|uniref:Dipeptidyl aminopeptidase/acylaminoacyl peptidase n=1 Tax=Aliidiomarina maris TaxID=531312 RepID=A0A327X4M0_9GAMM|nr:S9 family peptidase [Aliidiomarina maris]RAK01845.1 dipeptidyl aminopeptidase/acylaminoacyl peptidase [Aliidiomarina maris]RUO28653.1 S9 family peptidase [Aliidiomarina maris]
MVRYILVYVSLIFASTAASAEQIPTLEDYARHAQYLDIKISPEGNYLAASSRMEDGNIRLTVLDIENMQPLSAAEGSGRERIGSFHWATNERLIMTMAREAGALAVPVPTGEIMAMNADGSRREILTGRRSRDREPVFAQVVDWLPDEPENILIFQQNFTHREPFLDVYRMRIDGGRKRSEGRIPLRNSREGGVNVITDGNGIPRIAIGVDPQDNSKRTIMLREGNSWNAISSHNEFDMGFSPVAFVNGDTAVVGVSRSETDTTAISILDLETMEEEILAVHPNTDLSPIFSINRGRPGEVVGAFYEYEGIHVALFGGTKDEIYVDILEGLIGAFPSQSVNITSATTDNNKLIVRVGSANVPTTFYFFDREENQLSVLAQAQPWLANATLPRTQSYIYQARDGQDIEAVLTLPHGVEAKDLPLIMLPHGGPHGPRDSIASIDSDAKVLAQHGYAVLQPNFRGSGGYGQSFEEAGYKRWGTLMIDDMTDGVHHLAERGIIDIDRVCAYGGSYGGYAALQSAIREPDLYKCTVGFVGVFDLDLMFEEGDIPQRESGVRYLNRVLPSTPEERISQSPVHNVDKLKAPVFIIHGEEDIRVPITHAYRLRDALQAKNHPVEWMVKEHEGHGFFNPENNVERWTRMLAFFDRYIGDDE